MSSAVSTPTGPSCAAATRATSCTGMASPAAVRARPPVFLPCPLRHRASCHTVLRLVPPCPRSWRTHVPTKHPPSWLHCRAPGTCPPRPPAGREGTEGAVRPLGRLSQGVGGCLLVSRRTSFEPRIMTSHSSLSTQSCSCEMGGLRTKWGNDQLSPKQQHCEVNAIYPELSLGRHFPHTLDFI